ncbi:dTDP-4-dehydrorhamnose reductase [Candidatus Saccharibacteria bacterium]|nr:dTDP-4-dehydrorhamnose reductase [Candidatus Saccharibacteria bacterium]MBR0424045.1 dTDP-4-dehydrorhamnose reductase [Candidatus Saccharibacteria bacterium]
MKVLVTGTSGQLGYDVMMELLKRGHEAIGADRHESEAEFEHVILDITDAERVSEVVKEIHPDAIIHCAAWTNVDGAEDPANYDKVMAVNVEGTGNLARVAKEIDAKMMYISTDYVFDGQGEKPWEPDDKNYAPLNVYGESKLKGELEASENLDKYFIVRIAWVFGKNGNNFIKTMIKVGEGRDMVEVVADQIGTPTYTFDLSRLLVDMIETDKYGYYHATNEGGYISWAEFAEEIYKDAGMDVEVKAVTTAEYEAKAGKAVAKRPFNSRLDKAKLVENGFKPLPDWKDAVKKYIAEL